MSKYFEKIGVETVLDRKINDSAEISNQLYALSAVTISKVSNLQNSLQQMIYVVHGRDLLGAQKALKEFPNPKSRFRFLADFNFQSNDEVVDVVFKFVQDMFQELYELRNALSHEVWGSSDAYPNAVLLSGLDEESRLEMARGKFFHVDGFTPLEVYNAAVRFIRKVKVVREDNLALAIGDISLAIWIMMNIRNVLLEEDAVQRSEARNAFLVFNGTSHLFRESDRIQGAVNYVGKKSKDIAG